MKHIEKINFKNDDTAISSVIGVILMVFLTIVMATTTMIIVFNNGATAQTFTKTPMAIVEIEGIENYGPKYNDININLRHKGGDSLLIDSTMIVISGNGSSFIGVVGVAGVSSWTEKDEDATVKYTNLAYVGKRQEKYIDTNSAALGDGLWSTGEQLILNGEDSSSGINASTVLVTVNGFSSDYDNYGFRSGSTVTIKILDATTQRMIAESTAIVKSAE